MIESIVCVKETEKKMIQDFFVKGGRDLKGYERCEMEDVVAFAAGIRVDYSTRIPLNKKIRF